MPRRLLPLIAAALFASAAAADPLQQCTRSQTVAATDGGLSLVDRELVADELGGTINAMSDSVHEFLEGDLWVKKEFQVDDPTTGPAVLSVFASCVNQKDDDALPTLQVTFNGTELPYEDRYVRVRPYSGVYEGDYRTGKPHKSYWEGGWQQIPVPAKLVVKGTNVAILRARGTDRWRLMIEPSRIPNRSARSLDGGRTWDDEHLSRRGNLDGEYLVRLLLARHPAGGWIESDVQDLWAAGADGLARPAHVKSVELKADAGLPAGTRIEWFGRLGPGPTYDPKSWTPWTAAADLAAGKSFGERLGDSLRFFQWRAVLRTADRKVAPVLKSVRVSAAAEPLPLDEGLRVTQVRIDQPPHVVGSFGFTHGLRTKRMRLLERMDLPRKSKPADEPADAKFTLEDVIAKGTDEVQRVTRIAAYVARETNLGNHKPGSILRDTPDYDALLSLELGDKVITHSMCVNEAATFVQLANALGWPARRVFWSHAIAEVWLNTRRKWMAVDASGGFCYVFADGTPASFLDIAANADKTGTVKILPQYRGGARGKAMGERDAMFFTRFWMPLRSNYLEAPGPGELGQGTQGFKYNGYLRWQDPRQPPFPWFDFYSARAGDFAWTCNGTQIHLARTSSPSTLSVQLAHDMPNFKRFESRTNGGPWQPAEASSLWNLAAGQNTLEVRALNDWQAEALDSGDAARAATVLDRLVPIVSKATVQVGE